MNDIEREVAGALSNELQQGPASDAVRKFPAERQQRSLPDQFEQMRRIGMSLKEAIIRSVTRMKADYEATQMELRIKHEREVSALDRQLETDLETIERDFRTKLDDLQRLADKI